MPNEQLQFDLDDEPEQTSTAYYDGIDGVWRCDDCDAVLLNDGDCPRCNA